MDFTPFLQWLGDLFKALVMPEQGTKFLMTLSGIVGILFLVEKGYPVQYPDLLIGAFVVIYIISDLIYKVIKLKQPAVPEKEGGS